MTLGCQQSTHLSPTIPANLLEPCPNLQILNTGLGKEVLLWSVDTIAKYNDCKARHLSLIKALKDLQL